MTTQATIADVVCRIARISEKTHWTFIEVVCSDGIVGIGEASTNGMETALRAYAGMLGAHLAGLQALPNAVDHVLRDARGGLPQRAVASAVEQALWDAQGKRLGLPVTDLLGGATRDSVPLYANINRGTDVRSPGGFATSAGRAVASGFRAIKLAPFDGVGEGAPTKDAIAFHAGLDCIAAVCDAVGTDIDVMVDCHWRLDEPRAAQLLDFAADRNLYWVECPIAETPHRLPELRRLKQRATDLGVRLAGMEKGVSPADFQPYIAEQLYDVLMPDVKYDGGLGATRHIAEAALSAGIFIAPHNPTGPICYAASVAVSATLPNLLFLEVQFGESDLFWDLVGGAYPFVDGSVAVSTEPGFGVTLKPDVLAALER